jgi:hypothetical protein
VVAIVVVVAAVVVVVVVVWVDVVPFFADEESAPFFSEVTLSEATAEEAVGDDVPSSSAKAESAPMLLTERNDSAETKAAALLNISFFDLI